jgi:signal peptidase complex subunit 1
MDFKGQQLAEFMHQLIGIFCAVVGFCWGWWYQDFSIPVRCVGFGILLSCILCVPDWPFFNRHPNTWQPARFFNADGVEVTQDQHAKLMLASEAAEEKAAAKASGNGDTKSNSSSSSSNNSSKGNNSQPPKKKQQQGVQAKKKTKAKD